MITPDHLKILTDAAISPDVATALGLYSNTERDSIPQQELDYLEDARGIVMPWVDYLTGQISYQIRLDRPHRNLKYAWPAGQTQKLALIHRGPESGPVLLVEGYKQALACQSVLPADHPYTILAMAGCYGTSRVDTEGLEDRHLFVILDADVRKNAKVHDAAEGIAHQLKAIGTQPYFIVSPGTGSQGIDDVLAARTTLGGRRRLLLRLIEEASMELPAKPNVVSINAKAEREKAEKPSNPEAASKILPDPSVMDEDGKFVPHVLSDRLVEECIIFSHPSNPIFRYDKGVYRELDETHLKDYLWVHLADYYRPNMCDPVETGVRAMIRNEAFFPDPLLTVPWLNTPSCLVNLDTGEMIDHSPEIYTTFQIGTEYQPEATCPTFDQWLLDMTGEQGDALLEYLAQMLDPSRYPDKHILLEGPPGTGKSTLMRIIRAVVSGSPNKESPYCTSLTMKQINEGNFNHSVLLTSIFNAAGELEDATINDITDFKMITGQDQITANRKNKSHITFTPRALQCLAMNAFPKIKDSEPYFRRMAPFRFENQAGYHKSDPTIEDRIKSEEREGVLVRLVEARRRTMERGRLPEVMADVVKRFQGETNPVIAWFWSEDNPFAEGWYPKTEVYQAYRSYHIEVGGDYDSQILFTSKLLTIKGVGEGRQMMGGKRVRAIYLPYRPGVVLDTDDDGEDDPPVAVRGRDQEVVAETITQETKITPPEIQGGPLVTFDLETDSVSRMFMGEPHEYFRIGGWVHGDDEEVSISADPTDIPLSGVIPVGQNIIGFDLLALHRAGMYDLERIVTGEQLVLDTKIIGRQVWPPEAKETQRKPGPHSLAKLAERYGIEIHKDVLPRLAREFDTSGLKSDEPGFTGFGEIPLDHPEYREYLGKDVEVTREVLNKLVPPTAMKLLTDPAHNPETGMVAYLRREHRLAAIAALMSNTGIRVNEALMRQRVDKLDARKAEMLADLVDNYDLPTEGKAPWTSNAGKEAIHAALLDLGMSREGDQIITEKGQRSFSGDSMQQIIDRNPGNEELAELCRLVAELNGQRSIYHTVAAHLQTDGRVHPQIDFGQATGRWSITKPGLTVVSKRGVNATEREIFLPDPGHVFLACDFAQVDARCVAAHSQDPEYLKLFFGDHDLHTEVALAVFHDASKRQLAKIVGHGWNYGGSPGALAAQSGADIEDVRAYDEAAKKRFAGVVDWQNEVRARGESGRFLDNGFGRKLNVDKRRAFTQAPGLVGQSCARDIAMESLLRMPKHVRECVRLFIHDELLVSVPENRVEEYRAEIVNAMTFEWRGVPFKADSSRPGENWYGCYAKD